MSDKEADLIKTIAVLTRKAQRERSARLEAEKLLNQKSRELYFAKQEVEASLFSIQEKSDQDTALIGLKSNLESILLEFNQNFLQQPLSNDLLQSLMDTLAKLKHVESSQLVFKNEQKTSHQANFSAGTFTQWAPHNKGQTTDSEYPQRQLIVKIGENQHTLGSLYINLSVPNNWLSTIEKQLFLFSNMISAAYQRQVLLDKTLAQKTRAEQSERSTKDFVAMINHELRTPLNGLLGNTELMIETRLSDYQEKLIKNMVQSGELLKVIINDLLDISKINAGMLELNEVAFSTLELTNAIQNTFAPQAAEKGLAFDFEIDPKTPENLSGDPDRIKQIFVNLIGNAIKFTDKGKISIKIDWHESSFRFVISDTGCGIPKEHLANLFDPFTQVNNRSNRLYEGTGLGLTICKLLVNEMLGQIALESQPDKGSSFTVTLPLAVTQAQQISQPAEFNYTDFDSLTVLVVEDSHINQTLIKMMLAKFNIPPFVVDNGQEAIDFLSDTEVDIVFMDCRMPVVDGFQATRELRKQNYTNPIIALTAGTTSTEIEQCKQCGMDDIVCKPYKIADLKAILMKWNPLN
ncbi:ATP-binding protein [Shewanella woodyi]|uniref:histidine kinase n=1 Tax=Shewanella woodyi (strain ATCC 51908 / MS32) TaxID=392500 RepID=B1KJ88_SHEWM|nr:ATP-binding protein [Shewanella woodyi]ACA87108.1 histidine kinase [Shewanella woodyi ATCC 51908]